MDNCNLGNFLKAKREEKKLTLGDVHNLGFDKSLLSKIERGLRFPNAISLKRLSTILDIDIFELFKVAGFLDDNDFFSVNEVKTLENSELKEYLKKFLLKKYSEEKIKNKTFIFKVKF